MQEHDRGWALASVCDDVVKHQTFLGYLCHATFIHSSAWIDCYSGLVKEDECIKCPSDLIMRSKLTYLQVLSIRCHSQDEDLAITEAIELLTLYTNRLVK